MSIFGTTKSKFVSGATTVELDYSLLYPVWGIADEIEHKSIVTGVRNWITKGDYAEFTVIVHLWKYVSPTPKQKLTTLLTYLHTDVTFYPHTDGNAVQDSTSTVVPFHITEIVPFYYPDNNASQFSGYAYDAVKLRFVASKYIDVTKSLV